MSTPTNPTGASTREWASHSPQEIVRRTRCQADDWSPLSDPATWRACCDLILHRLGAEAAPSLDLGGGEEKGANRIPEKYRAKIQEMLSWTEDDWLLLKAYFPGEMERFRKAIMGACLTAPGSCPTGPTASRSSGFAAAIPSRGWQPIETAPKDSTDVLLWVSGIPMVAYWLNQLREEPGWYISDGHTSHLLAAGTPTHWMPLPAPPDALGTEARSAETEGLGLKDEGGARD